MFLQVFQQFLNQHKIQHIIKFGNHKWVALIKLLKSLHSNVEEVLYLVNGKIQNLVGKVSTD